MARWLALFGIILVVPLLGFATAEGIQAYSNYELRSVIIEQYPDADSAMLSRISLDELCETPSSELRAFCGTNTNLNFMSAGALGAGAAGLLFLLAIRLAGRAARNSRILLLYLFKPGLYLTILTLIGLILIHAALAIGIIYYGESALLGRIHVGIIGAISLGALAGVLIMARSVFSLVEKAHTLVIGSGVSRSEAPELWNRVEQIADRLGALQPQHIVLGLDPNFFVTEANVGCLNENLSGRTLYCSLPLSRILSTNELSAIIGHELGHFKGLDTKFSRGFYPIYRGTESSIDSLLATGEDGAAAIALLPAIAILSYFLECFSVAESRISRDRELVADKEGASITDTTTFATALVKVHAFSSLWINIQQAAVEELKDGKAFVNASKIYADAVANYATPDALDGIAETHLSHPTDSHPSLGSRLKSLGVTINEVSEASLTVNPANPAINLIPEPERMEEDISAVFQVSLAQQHGIDLSAFTDDAEQGST